MIPLDAGHEWLKVVRHGKDGGGKGVTVFRSHRDKGVCSIYIQFGTGHFSKGC